MQIYRSAVFCVSNDAVRSAVVCVYNDHYFQETACPYFDDEERFAVVEEPILACFFRLEVEKGSIFVSIEDSEGSDIVPVVPNETTPPSWNLPHLTSGRYVVYGLCTKEDRGAWTSNVNPTCSPRGIASFITQGHILLGTVPSFRLDLSPVTNA
ncbi:hypothetical protein R1sor_017112 [Riccia sorocarpa]|uniref:Uncharacterized protein n=1 Tax=Riccia sorocarpa TaxID=122646 RepID=A0ABD3I5V7_9MARC